MKKVLCLLTALIMLVSLAACGKPDQGKEDASDAAVPATDATDAGAPAAAPVDVSSWTWVKSELDCYDYTGSGGIPCYVSFDRPDNFTASEQNDSGEQYRGYNFNPDNPDATPNESQYGIYAYFMQGGYGGYRSGFEEDVEGGLQERELGGRTVYFGELQSDEITGSHTFLYYTAYDEDDWARIWILVTDPEADGAFRSTFEQSLNFVKE